MARVHLLNVGEGDCTIIEHDSGRRSMIDICSGNYNDHRLGMNLRTAIRDPMAVINSREDVSLRSGMKAAISNSFGNYGMKNKPTNPVLYLESKLVSREIFRFILTHPDMDHMDGFDQLISRIGINCFWDSGVRRAKPDFNCGRYEESDWDRYCHVRDDQEHGVKVLGVGAGHRFKYANWSEDGSFDDDGLYILAPNRKLVNQSILTGNMNDGSYVLLFKSAGGDMIFAGDAHDKTWEYVIENHSDDIKNCKFLLAPHHGRESSGNFDFLDVIQPALTLIGCAKSEHLAYQKWEQRGLKFYTQNQCGNMIIDTANGKFTIYIENETFARNCQSQTFQDTFSGYYYLDSV